MKSSRENHVKSFKPLTPGPAAVALAGLLLLVAACSPFKPDPRDLSMAPLPETFTMYSDQEPDRGKWWKAYGNEELNAMVEEALAANFSIQVAWARLRQAGASSVQARSDRFPTLNGTGDYAHTSTYNGKTQRDSQSETYSVGLSAGYEVDLWGRVQAQAAAGNLDYMASREDLSTTAVSVAGEVVSRWLEIQTQRKKKRILEKQIEANQTYLELIELRFRNSIATALDVYQQRQNLASVKAKLPPIESSERILLHELALLMGRPAGGVTVSDADLPDLPPLPGIGLPADLLAYRPDVRSAGLALASADWSVAEARANRLPSLNLTGYGEYSGTQLTNIFDTWTLGLAGSVVGPIFDGGYRKAAVEKARGVVDQRIAEYKETVFTAFKEVEDALTREVWQQKYIAALETQLEAARVSLREASSRYTQGLADYLPVLSALLSVQTLELSLADEYDNLLLYRVALHRALGGTWPDSMRQPVASAENNDTISEN